MKKSFALVYVLLFTMMTLTIIVMISGTMVTNIKLQRGSKSSIQAYNLARSAVDVAWGKYKEALEASESPPPGIHIDSYAYGSENEIYTTITNNIYTPYLKVKFPGTGVCASTDNVQRVDLNTDTDSSVLPAAILTTPNEKGIYDYKICYDGTNKYIKTVGYYKGTKVVLQATIQHYSDITDMADTAPRDFYTADVSKGKTTTTTNWLSAALGWVTTTTCSGYDTPQKCGNDPSITGLPLCTTISSTNPSECTSANVLPKLDTIHFIHDFDKLEISQISS